MRAWAAEFRCQIIIVIRRFVGTFRNKTSSVTRIDKTFLIALADGKSLLDGALRRGGGSLEADIGVLVLSQRTEVVVAFEEVEFWKTGAQHSRGRVYLL